jgi:hypothetical protein
MEYMREAERLIIEGDSVGGDKNIYLIGGKEKAPLRYLSPWLSEPVQHAFVAPAGYDDLRSKFDKKRTIILRGPDGYGKLSAAIRMLLDLNMAPIFHLDSRADLARLAEQIQTDLSGRDRIEQGAGFVLAQPSSFAGLYGSTLHGLDAALDQAQARLVITVGADVSLPDEELRDYVIDLTVAPDCMAVAKAHLGHRIGSDTASELLARDDISREVANHLAADPSCRLASELADAIAEEAERAGTVAAFDVERIKAWKTRREAEGFDIWFAGLGDTRSRSFAVALAVLDRLPYAAVAKAARMLYGKFDKPAYFVMASAGDDPPEHQRPFLSARREWLHKLRARAEETKVRGPYGLSYAEAIRYRDHRYAIQVIDRAWSDYESQRKLLDWLGDLTQDGAEQVRIRAGAVLGKLAAQSFDYLSQDLLARWAASNQQYQRDAVAFTLRNALTTDPRLSDSVRLMVAGWYGNSDSPYEQATAARVHGVAYGPTDPVAAIEALNRLTVIDHVQVAIAIGDSIADLLAAETDEFACYALEKLAESVHDPDRSAAAQLAFLVVAAPLDKEVMAPGGGITGWPLLLYLMAQVGNARPALVSLWQYVLNAGLLDAAAEEVLTRWAAAAEADPAIRQAFLRAARAIAGDERSRMILGRYAAKWAASDNLLPLPGVSAALQAVLNVEGGIL